MKSSAFLIGGTTSGSGKTTLTLGILQALKRRGLKIQPFKCGPDFIDPTLHTLVTGSISRNLDLKMCGKDYCRLSFARNMSTADIGVVEGVMGLFDGGEASSAALAETLGIPVILVVDVRSAAESIAAVVKGFEYFCQQQGVSVLGVLFNRVGSPRHELLVRNAVNLHCSSSILGFFPRDTEFTIAERHLGLHMGDENPIDQKQLGALADSIENNIDLDLLIRNSTVHLHQSKPVQPVPEIAEPIVKIAIAQDKPFCFYYQDNLDILQNNGAQLVPFSPLNDQDLPGDIDAVYLGGGYPEMYAQKLSENESMRQAINNWSKTGGVLYAECGGFMYLCSHLVDLQGNKHPMAGVFPFQAMMKNRLTRLGYRKAAITNDFFMARAGDELHGHEFHYSEIAAVDSRINTVYQLQDNRVEGYQIKNSVGSYLHLHFGQSEKNVRRFIQFILAAKKS